MRSEHGPRAAVAALAALAAAAGGCGGKGQEGSGAPNIEVEPASHDLGVVPLGQRVERTFTLRNTGEAPLSVEAEPTVETLEGC